MSPIIALTGATGFIGSTLAHRLRATHWRIRALVRTTSSKKRLTNIGAHCIEGDLNDPESLRRLVRGANAVVHCAGAVRGASPAHFMSVNKDGVGRLVQAAAARHPLPRFLLISSLAAREPHLSSYAASKKQGEETLAAEAGKMQWAVLRPSAVYGPGDKELLPLFRWMYRGFAPVVGPINARFSMLYVEDLAEAVKQWLTYGNTNQCIFEVHDGRINGYGWENLINTMARFRGRPLHRLPIPASLLEFLAVLNVMIARVAGYDPMLSPGKVRELRHPNWVCDNALLTRETGWTPRVCLEEGLRLTLKSDTKALAPLRH